MDEYNNERPYQGMCDVTHPDCDKTIMITNCGRLCIKKMKVHLSKAFANQPVGLLEADDYIWEVHFMDYHLGYFDEISRKFVPREDPFGIKLDRMLDNL